MIGRRRRNERERGATRCKGCWPLGWQRRIAALGLRSMPPGGCTGWRASRHPYSIGFDAAGRIVGAKCLQAGFRPKPKLPVKHTISTLLPSSFACQPPFSFLSTIHSLPAPSASNRYRSNIIITPVGSYKFENQKLY